MLAEDEYRLQHPDEIRVYDAKTDSFRKATQGDVDLMAGIVQLYGQYVEHVNKHGLSIDYFNRMETRVKVFIKTREWNTDPI